MEVERARIACDEGRYGEAILILDPIARSRPDLTEALRWLCLAFRESGSLEAALGVAIRAVSLRPNDAQLANDLGLCQMKLLMLREARSSFLRSLSISEQAGTANNLGEIHYMLGRNEEAIDAYKRALVCDGSSIKAYTGLGRSYLALDQLGLAMDSVCRAFEICPEDFSAHMLQAHLLTRNGSPEKAREHALRATEIDPNNAEAHALLGQTLLTLGQVEDAPGKFERSLEIEPRQGFAYLGLIFGRKVTADDRRFEERMLAVAEDPRLAKVEVQHAHYALGRLYEGLGEPERAIRHYEKANLIARNIKFRGEPFDLRAFDGRRNRAISFFTRKRFDELKRAGSPEETPIFIVGMMRSGTSLMEQILSSHSKVAAAGEQPFWLVRGPQSFDAKTGTLRHDFLWSLAHDYLDEMRSFGQAAERITDKMPDNALALGFIHAAFPNARIIHMTRNPADTCFSIYATPNDFRSEYAHDKAAIAHAYRTHQRLMDHWREVLPPERLMDVSYEQLTGDLESTAREVVGFCGLEWDERCLRPEKNESPVITPSMWQVRQPVYRTSVQRWKQFEPWIPEFVELESLERKMA